MTTSQNAIVNEIDDLFRSLAAVNFQAESPLIKHAWFIRLKTCIEKFAPQNSTFANEIEFLNRHDYVELWRARAALTALREAYASSTFSSITELIHADVFSDFLEMADHLIEQSYKDPAAVIAGSVLEEHLRKLCDKNGVDVKKSDGSPKKADSLNSELASAIVYSKLDQKNVTAWLDLRNKAAHGKYTEYTKDQVALLIQSIRDFITRNPA